MSYFKTSYVTLQALARTGRYEDVAGFLVLARHASGLPHAGFEPYKLSGAGINSIHEKAGLSEETSRGVLERLLQLGVIRPVSPETKKAFFHARWEVVQGELDLDLPHAFVDLAKDSRADYSALRRLKSARLADPQYADKLKGVSDAELRLDSLMVLLALYRNTGMQAYGGINPACVYRKWEVKSQTSKFGSVRWGAEPDEKTTAISYLGFMANSLEHVGKTGKKGEVSDALKTRFWNAWHTIKTTGLVYEAVALFDTAPTENSQSRLSLTLRVNDYHAGAVDKTGDPSLLRSMEQRSGTRFAYYTPPSNDRDEPEAMWVILPDKRGALVGIWRPRFRSSNRDTGAWIDQEEVAINAVLEKVEAAAPVD